MFIRIYIRADPKVSVCQRGLSILLAGLASVDNSASKIDDSLINVPASTQGNVPAGVPLGDEAAPASTAPAPGAQPAPAQETGVPIE